LNQFHFKTENYGKFFSDLIDPQRLNDLGPGHADDKSKEKISSINLEQAFEHDKIKNTNYSNACLAGIWLHHDFLDESHTVSQNILTTSGSFWHGIMHRREGDYWNSKYWFRQVGDHPIFSFIQSGVSQIDSSTRLSELHRKSWDPFLFVDMVQKYIGTDSDQEDLCKKIQRLEWQILFDYCYQQAIS
jgi:hypothetical protein